MIEALIAVVLSILILVVFQSPRWAINLGAFGGLGFMLYVLILVIEWLLARVNRK